MYKTEDLQDCFAPQELVKLRRVRSRLSKLVRNDANMM